ncbi:alpha/beta hydrolase family protein [Streptomyces sp. NPDC059166]|uniref:alpha/beta hydrolase family protein n=1 Tax=Streptomyces sp. NPDC059166 TaxID=3346752 RepID=UPI0036881794
MTTGLRRRTALAALTALALLGAPAVSAQASGHPAAAAAATLELPRPAGPYAVGSRILHLTDHGRTDPWVPEADGRELMVSVHYPARPGGAGSPAPYMDTEEARLMLVQRGLDGIVPAATVGATVTHARTDTRPAPGRFPLVLLSPGFGTPRATLTSLAEELASRGYVVASVDHAYETTGTAFPGGRILTCAACDAVEAEPDDDASAAVLRSVSAGRATDLSFVLDRLTGPRPAWNHSRMIDSRRVAVVGHSIGGNAAASTMLADPRVDAGVNMDGTFFDPVPASGLGGRPFLMLGTDIGHHPGGEDESWDQAWRRLDGWKRWLTVKDSGHFTFTDLPWLAERFGLPADPEAPLAGDRSTEITRDYVAAFLDRTLKHERRPLLDGPSPQNPEVVLRRP